MDEIYLNHHKETAVDKEALQAFSFHAEKFWRKTGPKGAEGTLRSERYEEAILARLGALSEDLLYCFLDAEDAMQALLFSHYVQSIRDTGKNHILFAGISESVYKPFEVLGCVIKQIPFDQKGVLTIEALKKAVGPRVSMLSISLCDLGVIQPISEIAAFCRASNIVLHVDVAAAVGKIPIKFHEWGIDFLTGDGTFFSAPPGVAWLIARKKLATLSAKKSPLPTLALLSKALESSIEQMDSMQLEIAARRSSLEEGICRECPGAKILFSLSDRLPNISLISFPTIHQESLLFFFRKQQLYLEEVDFRKLIACGVDPLTAQGALFFALSSATTQEEIERAIGIVRDTARKLQKVSFMPPLGEGCVRAPCVSTVPYTRKLLAGIDHLRHAGAFSSHEGESKGMRGVFVTAGSVSEGKALHLSLLIDESDAVIADAKFQAYGSPLLLGILEATCAFLARKNLSQMTKLTAEIIEKQLQDRGGERAFGKEGDAFVNLVLEAICQVEEESQDLLDRHFEPPTPLTPSSEERQRYLGWEILSKEEKIAVIEEIVAADIRPYIELDDGGITVMDLVGNEVVISYQGACTTCYSSTGSTLQAIQTILQEKVSADLTVRPDSSLFHQSS